MSQSEDEHCENISKFTEDLIRGRGYPLEVHQVTTEDGYINSIYRINKNESNDKYPVLIVHGLVSSAADCVQEDHQPGYYFSDKGYDVWIPNCRGTTFSRGHVGYNHIENAKEYWNFSFHEIGYYDIAKFIDYVLGKTGFEKLFYVGLSQGSTVFTVLMSTRPEYNSKIVLASLLCPAINFKYLPFFPTKLLYGYIMPPLMELISLLNLTPNRIPGIEFFRKIERRCNDNAILRNFFKYMVFTFISGHVNKRDPFQTNLKKICVTSPNTASYKQYQHFVQLIKNGRFEWYDYGSKENLVKYGTEEAPLYDISKVTAPTAVFYSENDMYYGLEDIDMLSSSLGNCVHKHQVEHDQFNHSDFGYHVNVAELVYDHVFNLMFEYSK